MPLLSSSNIGSKGVSVNPLNTSRYDWVVGYFVKGVEPPRHKYSPGLQLHQYVAGIACGNLVSEY